MTFSTEEFDAKFGRVCNLPYSGQAQFFLNAFWDELRTSAQEVFDACSIFVDIDVQHGAEGKALESPDAHQAFERLGSPMRALELRQLLSEIDIKADNKLGLIEYLLYAYKDTAGVTVQNLLTRPQGDNKQLYNAQKHLKAIIEQQARRQQRLDELQALSESEKLSVVKRNQIKHELDMELTAQNDNEILLDLQRCQSKIERAAVNGDGNLLSTEFWLRAEIAAAEKFQKTYISTGRPTN